MDSFRRDGMLRHGMKSGGMLMILCRYIRSVQQRLPLGGMEGILDLSTFGPCQAAWGAFGAFAG